MTFNYSKSLRLRRTKEFRFVLSKGREVKGRLLVLCTYACSKDKGSKFGVIASKHFGNAVQRNRFKRLSREAFRHLQTHFTKDIKLVIKPRKYALDASMQEVQEELTSLLKEIF